MVPLRTTSNIEHVFVGKRSAGLVAPPIAQRRWERAIAYCMVGDLGAG
jgi:hypothetical protein